MSSLEDITVTPFNLETRKYADPLGNIILEVSSLGQGFSVGEQYFNLNQCLSEQDIIYLDLFTYNGVVPDVIPYLDGDQLLEDVKVKFDKMILLKEGEEMLFFRDVDQLYQGTIILEMRTGCKSIMKCGEGNFPMSRQKNHETNILGLYFYPNYSSLKVTKGTQVAMVFHVYKKRSTDVVADPNQTISIPGNKILFDEVTSATKTKDYFDNSMVVDVVYKEVNGERVIYEKEFIRGYLDNTFLIAPGDLDTLAPSFEYDIYVSGNPKREIFRYWDKDNIKTVIVNNGYLVL